MGSSPLFLTLCLVLFFDASVTSASKDNEEECASEFHLPKKLGHYKISVRLFFQSPWHCFLTNPVHQQTRGFVNSLNQLLLKVHNSSEWFKEIYIHSLGKHSESVIAVDYDVILKEKVTLRLQLNVAQQLFAKIWHFGDSITLNGTAAPLDKHPALVIHNSKKKIIYVYVNEIFENPCELLTKSDSCGNGGTCEVERGLPYCRCIEGYEGTGCQRWKKAQERRALTILIILLVMMAFCISIFIFVTCCKNPLQFRFYRPMPKLALPLLGKPSQAVATPKEKCQVAMSPGTPSSPVVTPTLVHFPLKVPPLKRQEYIPTVASEGPVLTVTTPNGMPPAPPVLLPLSEVPSARLSTRPTQDYLKINKKFKLYKCNGKFSWKKN